MPELVDAARISEILGVTTRTVRNYAASGIMPGAIHLPGGWRFDEAKIRRWRDSLEAKPQMANLGALARASIAKAMPSRPRHMQHDRYNEILGRV